MARIRALYIEREAADYPHGRTLLHRFADRPVIFVDSYTEVFSRPNQNFQAQKRAPALVAAVARPPYLYQAPVRVSGSENLPVYYNDQLRNCVYNCDYCFLQGMHASGYPLVFVNSGDFHDAAAEQASCEPYWLSISYLTDIMGFEETLPLVSEWIEFARTTPRVTLEVRTKGGGTPMGGTPALQNVVFVWTLSPPLIAARYERGCASFAERLAAAEIAAAHGWRVRIAVDPVVLVPGWQHAYSRMIETVFARLPASSLESATYGVFRMGRDFMNRIVAARADSPALHYPFTRAGGLVTYSTAEIDAVHRVVGDGLRSRMGDRAVRFVHG